SDVDQHAGKNLRMDRPSQRGRNHSADPWNFRAGRCRAFVYRRISTPWYGVQLPSIYDSADSDVFKQDGSFPFGGKRGSWSKSGADVPEGNTSTVSSGSYQWNYTGIPAGSQFLLYPEAFGRRTVFPHRKYD